MLLVLAWSHGGEEVLLAAVSDRPDTLGRCAGSWRALRLQPGRSAERVGADRWLQACARGWMHGGGADGLGAFPLR